MNFLPIGNPRNQARIFGGGMSPIGNPNTMARINLARMMQETGRNPADALRVNQVPIGPQAMPEQSPAAPPMTPYSRTGIEALQSPQSGPVQHPLEALARALSPLAGNFQEGRNMQAEQAQKQAQMQALAQAVAASRGGDPAGAMNTQNLTPEMAAILAGQAMKPETPPTLKPEQLEPRNIRVGGPGTVEGGDVRDETWNVRRDPNTGNEALVNAAPRFAPDKPDKPDMQTITLGMDGQQRTLRRGDPEADTLMRTGWTEIRAPAAEVNIADKPLSLGDAGQIAAIRGGTRALEAARGLLFTTGQDGKQTFNRVAAAQMNNPLSESRMIKGQLVQAVRTMLSVMSGKTVTEQEAEAYAVSFIPSFTDTDAVALDKMQRFRAFFDDFSELARLPQAGTQPATQQGRVDFSMLTPQQQQQIMGAIGGGNPAP